jgi:DNA-binding transcriptional ArsR family regulator
MPRSAATADAFNAVAEPQRRAILGLLARGEQPVNDLVASLGANQPRVSKHLRVLRHVGLVNVRGEGQQRLYSLNAGGLKPIYDWAKSFEQFWNQSFDRLADYLDELQADPIRLKPHVRVKSDPTRHKTKALKPSKEVPHVRRASTSRNRPRS